MLRSTYMCDMLQNETHVLSQVNRILAQKKYCSFKTIKQCSSSPITCPFICILK